MDIWKYHNWDPVYFLTNHVGIGPRYEFLALICATRVQHRTDNTERFVNKANYHQNYKRLQAHK
jgi:hypothetical protein